MFKTFIRIVLFTSLILILQNCKKDGSASNNNTNGKKQLQANGAILSLNIDNSGNIYAGGAFKNDSGYYYVAKWDGNSWRDLFNGSGTLQEIDQIKTYNNSLYIVSGQSVMLWDGSTWNIAIGSHEAYSLTIDSKGILYVGGSNTVSKWDGSSWTQLGTSFYYGYSGTISNIVADLQGNIYAAGDINYINNGGWHYVAKWNGSSWVEVGSAIVGFFEFPIRLLYRDAANNIYAGYGSEIGPPSVLAEWDGNNWTEFGSVSSPI